MSVQEAVLYLMKSVSGREKIYEEGNENERESVTFRHCVNCIPTHIGHNEMRKKRSDPVEDESDRQ